MVVSWSTRQMVAEVSYYFDISTENLLSVAGHISMRVFPFIPSIVSVNTWLLCAVLKAVSRDLYFAVANKKPGPPGFSSGWHFSCHAIHFGLNWGWAGRLPAEKYHHSPQLETLTSRLGTVLHLEEDWISATLDVFLKWVVWLYELCTIHMSWKKNIYICMSFKHTEK